MKRSRRDTFGHKALSRLVCVRVLSLLLASLVAVVLLTSCGQRGPFGSDKIGQTEVIMAQEQRKRRVPVTIDARVVKVLPEDKSGMPHQKFLIGLSNGTKVLVAHNIRLAQRVPLQKGDFVRIHGEYIWNETGGIIHWTHHTTTPRHEDGWIEHDGNIYQ